MKFYARHLRNLFWLVYTFYLDHGSHNLQHGTTGVFLFEQRLNLRLNQAQHTTLYINLNFGAHHWRGIRAKGLLLNAVLGAHCFVAEAGSDAVVPGVLSRLLLRRAGCTSSPRPLAGVCLCQRPFVAPAEQSSLEDKARGSFVQTGVLLTSFLPVGSLMSSGRDRSLLRFSGGMMGRGQTMVFSRAPLAPS